MDGKIIYDNTLDRAEIAIEAYQYGLATALAGIAEARAAERQAAALERIAALLEQVTNNEMLSVAFWKQV